MNYTSAPSAWNALMTPLIVRETKIRKVARENVRKQIIASCYNYVTLLSKD